MDLVEWMLRRGGVVKVAHARAAEYSARAMAGLVGSGVASRPRGGWLALTDSDPHLVAAARAGVVLSCVTQAARLELWDETDGVSHLAAAPHATTISVERAVVHWNRPWVKREPGLLVDPIENVLQVVAYCQPYEQAFVVWESALRKNAVEREVIARMPLSGQAARLIVEVTPFSDSGLESYVLVRLRWLDVPVVPQVWIAGRRVDFLIGDRLVLQIDGGHHVGAQREADIAHDALLMSMGYHVIRVGYAQVMNRWHSVQDLILRAIAQGLHRV